MERLAYRLVLAYGGRHFAGWQRQPGRPTIQETLAATFMRLGVDVKLAAAARTDAGVSARRQVVTFRVRRRLETTVLTRALNAALPRQVRVLEFAPAPPSFHARASAVRKEYRYRLRIGLPPASGAWSLPDPRSLPCLPAALQVDATRAFLEAQLGRRDRSPYTTRPDRPVETDLEVAELIEVGPGRWLFRFVGGTFTRHLVRNWVWASVAHAAGAPAGFESPAGWRGPRAPGHGLVLWEVGYASAP